MKPISLTLPEWLMDFTGRITAPLPKPEDRMALVIEASRLNILNQTGGPFGAAVFDRTGGRLISLGVNLVIHSGCSIWHAEMTALALAQNQLGTPDLSSRGGFELVSSCEPCAMCLGAIPWSGIRFLICGAGERDARSAGFDEGAKPEDWTAGLRKRGIDVATGLMAAEAAEVITEYARLGGPLY